MGYSIWLEEPITKEIVLLDEVHLLRGGTYCMGGTREAWLSVTYNYSEFYYSIFGENGIRGLYGLTGVESVPFLKGGISKLKDDVSSNYWESTEGNAKKALLQLLSLAQLRPDAIWNGD